jgi:hypothetical protein
MGFVSPRSSGFTGCLACGAAERTLLDHRAWLWVRRLSSGSGSTATLAPPSSGLSLSGDQLGVGVELSGTYKAALVSDLLIRIDAGGLSFPATLDTAGTVKRWRALVRFYHSGPVQAAARAETRLYELRPYELRLGEISEETVLAAIRGQLPDDAGSRDGSA